MTPQELKNSILQLAIQGRLVEQRPEEGTAEELYREIRKKIEIESDKTCKRKKSKTVLPVSDNDKPFDIPSTWKWVRLGEMAEIYGRIGFRGYTKNDIVRKGGGAITISPSNILSDGKTDFTECTYLSWEKYYESPEIMISEDDILLVKTGSSYGKCGIVKNLPISATINPQIVFVNQKVKQKGSKK